jgi:hypothetical protein
MKFYHSLLFLMLCLCSCKKLVENVVNDVDFPYENTVDIPADKFSTTNGELTGAQEKVIKKNPALDNLKEARLTALEVTLTQPASLTLGLIKEVNVFIRTDSVNGNLSKKLIAYAKDIPTNTQKTLSLTCTQEEVAAYVRNRDYIIRTELVLRQTVAQDVQIKNKLTFRLKPNL